MKALPQFEFKTPRRNKFEIWQRGDLNICASAIVLKQFASDLAAWLPDISLKRKTYLYLGIHETAPIDEPQALHIGVQSEQIYNAKGQSIQWNLPAFQDFGKRASRFSWILELSEDNKPYYERLASTTLPPIDYGPFVFPTAKPSLPSAQLPKLAFVGAKTPRREALVQARGDTDFLARGHFGNQLHNALRNYSALLNIHVHPASHYSEIPRLLMAYVRGKLLYSETLAPPFVEGRHYLAKDAPRDAKAELRVLQNIHNEIASQYSIERYLHEFLDL